MRVMTVRKGRAGQGNSWSEAETEEAGKGFPGIEKPATSEPEIGHETEDS